MKLRPGRRAVAVVLTVAVLAAGCGGSSKKTGSESGQRSDAADSGLGVQQARDEFAAAGVRVLADDSDATIAEPSEPVSVVTLRDSQVRSMAAEASGGAGFLGSDLDALGGGIPEGLPPSAFLAAYARGVDTDSARVARRLLGDQDLLHPDRVVFPSMVLMLFAADASRSIGSDADATTDSQTSRGAPRTADGVALLGPSELDLIGVNFCKDIAGEIFGIINQVFARLNIPPGRVGDTGSAFLNGVLQGLTDVVVGALNFVIGAAKVLIVTGVEWALSKVLTVVAKVATLAALVANIVSAARKWYPKAVADLSNIEKTTVAIANRVTVSAPLDGPDAWPVWFEGCANLAGVTLPPLKPIGAEVTWLVFELPANDLLHETEAVTKKGLTLQEETKGENPVARLGLETGIETEQQKTGDPSTGQVTVYAKLKRTQIREIQTLLENLATTTGAELLAPVPDPFKSWLLGLLTTAVSQATNDIASLFDGTAKVDISVVYHGKPKEKDPVAALPATRPGEPCSLISDAEAAIIIGAGVTRNEPTSTPEGSSCIKGTAREPDVRNGAFLSYSVFLLPLDTFLVATEAGAEGKATLTEVGGVGDRALTIDGAGVLVVGAGDKTMTIQIYRFGTLGTYDELVVVARKLLERI